MNGHVWNRRVISSLAIVVTMMSALAIATPARAQSSSGGGCTNDNNASVCIWFVVDGPNQGHVEFNFSVSGNFLPAQVVTGGGASLQLCNYSQWGGCGSGYYTTMSGTGTYPTATFVVTDDGDAHASITFFGLGGAQRTVTSPQLYWTLSSEAKE